MTAIRTRALSKRYGSLQAVHDLDLTVERGEVFGFLGPNGAGKSTFIDMLLDLTRPTAGEVSVLGYDPQEEPQAVRERIGVLPESVGYYDKSTAREHVSFAARMKRVDDPEGLLSRVGLSHAADREVGGFSKGMRRRLGLAIALVGEPELIILDEPLSGLDPAGARLLRDAVRTERERGAAVFFSSHVLETVETLCDRVGVMNEGSLVAVDTLDNLRAAYGDEEFVVTLDAVPAEHGVESLEGVRETEIDGETLRLVLDTPLAKARVVRTLEQAGATVLNIETGWTPMADLFREVTGGDGR
jgi:ABC-2 type transport system ATP-binding protein